MSNIPRRKTNEEFQKEVHDLVGDEYTFLEPYKKNNSYKLKVRHNTCGNLYAARPKDFLKGHRCPKCALKNLRISPKKYAKDFKTLKGDKYTLLSEYTMSNEPITFKCNTCEDIITIKKATYITVH